MIVFRKDDQVVFSLAIDFFFSILFNEQKAERTLSKVNLTAKKQKLKDPKMSSIKLGIPLPENGTCRHYKRSKRWLRFPCCGRAFPCDLCHEESNPNGHSMKWATRQLCGSCSKEQSVNNLICSSCSMPFTLKSNAFWEGGKGCRDHVRLNRNDSHKFRNLSKTQSQKVKRVGPHEKKS